MSIVCTGRPLTKIVPSTEYVLNKCLLNEGTDEQKKKGWGHGMNWQFPREVVNKHTQMLNLTGGQRHGK